MAASTEADDAAIFRALRDLEAAQPLNRLTHAVHAAAWCDVSGNILSVREDVGRHNAFDKLIGAMARAANHWHGCFTLLTSRCSFELVDKAVLANCPMLVLIQMPTLNDPQVSEKQYENLDVAKKALGEQAGQEELRLEAFTSATVIGQRVLLSEHA